MALTRSNMRTWFVLLGIALVTATSAEILQKQGDVLQLDASDSSYRMVKLRCGANSMQVEVVLEKPFDGVIYTRGSYHKREPPCFLDPAGGSSFTLRFPFDKCNTKHDSNTYSNTVVVQFDDELIMPGDAAFTVECDFNRHRDVTVSADLAAQRGSITSRISIADTDPAGPQLPRHRRSTISNDSESVSFTPEDVRPRRRPSSRKDEL